MDMKILEGGVTSAAGFLAAGAEAGIKYKNRKDMALVYSKVPARTAGTFTTNIVKAAPVVWDQEIIKTRECASAVLLNSGIANACTSEEGKKVNRQMAEEVAEALKLCAEDVLTASTGVIGMQIPMDKVKIGVKKLEETLDGTKEAGTMAAEAIMTTDTVKKEFAVEFILEGKTITLGGMSKGSGMIHPNMATMLSVITTDLAISKALLQKSTSDCVKDTFNMISVDRDTSTNDTCIVMANGLAGNTEITEEDSEGYLLFSQALKLLMTKLAMTMAKDGEGATKLFETKVIHCSSKEKARLLAKSVITSNLVKTAVYGSDANWGRILCAMGYSGADFDPENVDLYIEAGGERLMLFENGMAADYSEEKATQLLSQEEVTALVDMKEGEHEAVAWGCDLTYDYIKINGDYRS